MGRTNKVGLAIAALVILLIGLSNAGIRTAAAQARQTAAREVPIFQVDPSWPKIPSQWVVGPISSVSVDEQDHVWILQRPRSLTPDQRSRAAPPVMEFDAAGNFIQGWGGSGAGYQWPESEHGIFVDYKGYVWIGGNNRADPGKPDDDHVLKFTKAGKFVMQIGHAGQAKGNKDTANMRAPADTFIYPKTNELFVADGYVNKRVIVYDADTGAFKRMWGAFGNVPSDNPSGPDDGGAGPKQFNTVHAARVSKDGLVYVSDRAGKRVQVFTLDGKYLAQAFIERQCQAPQCGNGQTAASTAFSADAEQRFLYVASRSPQRIMVLDRKTLEILDSFGRPGKAYGEFNVLHHMGVDSKGNLYVTEVEPGRRIQKFVFKGISSPATARSMSP